MTLDICRRETGEEKICWEDREPVGRRGQSRCHADWRARPPDPKSTNGVTSGQGRPETCFFLTYIHMWRSNIYVFLTQKYQNPHRSSDSWPPWENQKPWPLWVPSPAQNRGRVEGALSGCCTPAAGSTQAFSHSACQMGSYICDTAHCKPNLPVLQTGRQRPRKSGEAPRFNPGLLTLSLCSFSALNLKALSFHLGLSLLVCKREQ